MSKNLAPGTTIPDFELPDENGGLHRLSELQGDNVLVLHLSRGEHCPRERQFHRELLRFHEWSAVAFTELVSVLPNELHDVYRLKSSTGAAWTFLSDDQLAVQRHFDINEYTDTHHDYAAVPHTLILSPGLRIEKVYVGYWFWGRPTIYQLWADLGEIHMRIKADFDPTTPEARAAWEARQAAPPAACPPRRGEPRALGPARAGSRVPCSPARNTDPAGPDEPVLASPHTTDRTGLRCRSRAARTVERARCSSTRWLPSVSSRARQVSSA